MIDFFLVARLRAYAVATAGLTESIITLVYSIVTGLSIAITAMVARSIGKKGIRDATVVAVQALALGVFAAITIAESTLAVVAVLVFRQGKWKTR